MARLQLEPGVDHGDLLFFIKQDYPAYFEKLFQYVSKTTSPVKKLRSKKIDKMQYRSHD